MQHRRVISIFFAFSFASRCYFYLPILVIWFLQHDFTQFQVMCMISIYFSAMLLSELPTGILADRYGRRWALMAGSIAETIGVALLAFAAYWPIAALGEAILGVGQAFHTGAKEAFLYDHLHAENRASEYQQIYGKAKFFEFAAMSVGAFIGAPLFVAFGYAPFFASALIFAIGGLMLLFVEDAPRAMAIEKTHWSTLRSGYQEVRHGPWALKRLILYYAWFFSVILLISVTLSQPYLKDLGIAVKDFGIVFLGCHGLAVVGTLTAKRIREDWLDRVWFLPLALLFIVTLTAMAGWRGATGALVLGGIYIGWGLLLPTASHAINRLVDSAHRATVLSIQDFLQNLTFVITALTIGVVTDIAALQTSLLLLAGISLIVVGVTFTTRR